METEQSIPAEKTLEWETNSEIEYFTKRVPFAFLVVSMMGATIAFVMIMILSMGTGITIPDYIELMKTGVEPEYPGFSIGQCLYTLYINIYFIYSVIHPIAYFVVFSLGSLIYFYFSRSNQEKVIGTEKKIE